MKNRLTSPAALMWLLSVVLCLAGCGRHELMPWHTEVLDGEYSASNAKDVERFEDYLAREDAVFSELDQRFYTSPHTGAEHALERYNKGSLADPGQRQPDWNRSFELTSDEPVGGVLLLHGMTDSPYSLRALGEALQGRGFTVLGPRMPGHGTLPSGMLNLKWQDMAAVVRLGVAHLAERVHGAPVYIIAYSTGAALALDYALQAQQDTTLPPVTRMVLISPAIGVSPEAALAKWGRRLSRLPGLHQLAWIDIQPEFDPYKYNSFTANAAEQVFDLTQSVAKRVAARTDVHHPLPPMLIFKSAVDATVSNTAVVDRLLLKLAPDRHELVVFDINRFAPTASLLRDDPASFTARLIGDRQLPFTFTLVTNTHADSRSVSAFSRTSLNGASNVEALEHPWPRGVFSLSHVALPFPADDPLYGQQPPADSRQLFLGQQAVQGERGVLRIPENFLLRLRHNPFYDYELARILAWLQ